MHTWRHWMALRQAARFLATRGACHLRSHRLCLAWAAWDRWIGDNRVRRAAVDRAAGQRRASLQRRALGGLRWYRGYRRAKAEEMAAARAMHLRQLQREGAAQWLAVGLWRRTQRLQAMGQQKVWEDVFVDQPL